jgi:hypothetical protein
MSIDDEIPDPQYTELAPNADEDNLRAFANLGVNNDPDSMNPGDDEATDTLLYTDTLTARHATDELENEPDPDALTLDELIEPDRDEVLTDAGSDETINREISDLANDEAEGGARY